MTTIAEQAIVPFTPDTDDVAILELATMPVIEYERCREAKAEELGIRVSVLDKLVESKRPKEEPKSVSIVDEVEPWETPVSGADLIREVLGTIHRFCVLPDYSDIVMAFWVLHAHAHDAADISPILAFTSPEKRCGKSTALNVVSVMVPKPIHTVNTSAAVVFRVMDAYQPTVLIDEADTFLSDKDELRGILNGGHNRLTAKVLRTVGDDHEPRAFCAWAPKCIAMIGNLPDTLEDRALVVRLRRKQPGEVVERFRGDRIQQFVPLCRKAARWAQDNADALRGLDPDVPDALHDRAQDNARAMIAIADLIGGDWPELLRSALVAMASRSDDEPKSAGVLLLRDIAEIVEKWHGGHITSTDLVDELCKLEESPWAEWRRGQPITARGVAKLLKAYGITPGRTKTYRYYEITDFRDAFDRYLSDTPPQASPCVTNSQLAETEQKNGDAWGDTYDRVTLASVTTSQASPQVSPKNQLNTEPYHSVTLGDAYLGGAGRKGASDVVEGEL